MADVRVSDIPPEWVGFIKFWQLMTAADQAGRTRIMCSPHNNFPDWCFYLHHPRAATVSEASGHA